MSENQDKDKQPCLHCMIMDLLEDFFAEYAAPQGEPDAARKGTQDFEDC